MSDQFSLLSGLSERLQLSPHRQTIRSIGTITKVIGLTLESTGPMVSLGDLVGIENNPGDPLKLAEVVGFRDNHVLLMPVEGVQGIRAGARVLPVNEGFKIPVGPGLLGRVVDSLGRPIDGKGPLTNVTYRSIWSQAPDAMSRPRITTHFHTGVRTIDSALPCGEGQRLSIMAGSGVGKSTLLGMISRHSDADINVIALIGERGKEVRDFLEESLGEDGLAKSVVVVVTSDKPPLQRVKGPETAMAIAEFFRDQQQHVVVVMDSLTRYAMAQREIGLAVGEPPTTKGYPPSVFSMLPNLLERAGTSTSGSITGFFTVLVEADDMNDPIGDTVRSIVDGHFVLSRSLAGRGHYPPIDVLQSVSRVMSSVAEADHQELARQLRQILATFDRAEDMIAIGAYQTGSNPEIDRAIRLKPMLDEFMRQTLDEASPWDNTFQQLQAILQN